MTQAVASKSIASVERIKNQLFIKPFLSVFVFLINVFFSNYLIFNKLLREKLHIVNQYFIVRPEIMYAVIFQSWV